MSRARRVLSAASGTMTVTVVAAAATMVVTLATPAVAQDATDEEAAPERTPGTVLVEPPTVPTTTLADPRIAEASGLAASQRRDDVVWTHNDRDNDALLFAVSLTTGQTVATVRPSGVDLVDWEDLAPGPGIDGQPSLWVADTGSAGGQREDAALHVLPEPVLPDDVVAGDAPPLDLEVAPVSVPVTFPDGPRDVEALLVSPSGQVALVSREPDRAPARIYAAPPQLRRDATNELLLVGEYDLAEPFGPTADGGPPPNGRFVVTGGAVAPDGRAVVVRTYGDALVWPLEPGQQPADVLTSVVPTRFLLPATELGEAVAFAADGRSLLVTSEGVDAPVFTVPMPAEAGLGELGEVQTGTRVVIGGMDGTTDGAAAGDRPAGDEAAAPQVAATDQVRDAGTAADSPDGEGGAGGANTASVVVAILGTAAVVAALAAYARRRRGAAPDHADAEHDVVTSEDVDTPT